jgi:hypothetical protein
MGRLVPYLANGLFIVSERGISDPLDDFLSEAVVFAAKGAARVRSTGTHFRSAPPPATHRPPPSTPLAHFCIVFVALAPFAPGACLLLPTLQCPSIVRPPMLLQLTPDVILPYVGDGAAAVKARAARAAAGQRLARDKLACAALPEFRESVDALLGAAYPGWFAALFVSWPLAPSAHSRDGALGTFAAASSV